MGVGFGVAGECFGGEADFHVGLGADVVVGVKDFVEDGPAVDGFAGGVLGVGVGGAPFEAGRAVAGGEEVVGAEEGGGEWGAGVGEFLDDFFAEGAVSVIRLVVSAEAPDGVDWNALGRGVDADVHRNCHRGILAEGQSPCCNHRRRKDRCPFHADSSKGRHRNYAGLIAPPA